MKLLRPIRMAAIALAALCVLAILAWLVWRASFPTAAAAAKFAPSSAALALAQANASALKPAPLKVAKHSHDVAPELQFETGNDFLAEAHWLEAGVRNANDQFVGLKTPIVIDASCADRAELKHANLEEAIIEQAGFDPTQATPADVLVSTISQFWRIGATYYQMSGRWERDQPPTYRVTQFSSSRADFSEDIRVLPLPDAVPLQVDVLTLGMALDREAARAVAADGGERGARLTQIFYPSTSNNETLDLRLSNGRPVSWMFGNGRCQRRNTGDAVCRCVAPEAHQGHAANNPEKNKEKYRVHD